MGVTEEGTKVATSAISALSATPTLLVMVILNTVMIGATAWYLHDQAVQDARINELLIMRCYPQPTGSGAGSP